MRVFSFSVATRTLSRSTCVSLIESSLQTLPFYSVIEKDILGRLSIFLNGSWAFLLTFKLRSRCFKHVCRRHTWYIMIHLVALMIWLQMLTKYQETFSEWVIIDKQSANPKENCFPSLTREERGISNPMRTRVRLNRVWLWGFLPQDGLFFPGPDTRLTVDDQLHIVEVGHFALFKCDS